MRNLLIAIGTLFLVGCSEPTVDASTDDAMKESMAEVRESLPEGQRDEFDEAVKLITFNDFTLADLAAAGASGNAEGVTGKVKAAFDGKTAAQILAEADRIRAERAERERRQALQEIEELKAKQTKAEQDRTELAKFEVIRSRFYKQKREYMGEQPIIELHVRNGTAHPISRAYFVGTLASQNRSVPWLADKFNYAIAGGLEPGEEAKWSLAPNMFSDWGKVNAPVDAVLTVEVTRLDGPNNEQLFSSEQFSERDAERLEKLLSSYGEPEAQADEAGQPAGT